MRQCGVTDDGQRHQEGDANIQTLTTVSSRHHRLAARSMWRSAITRLVTLATSVDVQGHQLAPVITTTTNPDGAQR